MYMTLFSWNRWLRILTFGLVLLGVAALGGCSDSGNSVREKSDSADSEKPVELTLYGVVMDQGSDPLVGIPDAQITIAASNEQAVFEAKSQPDGTYELNLNLNELPDSFIVEVQANNYISLAIPLLKQELSGERFQQDFILEKSGITTVPPGSLSEGKVDTLLHHLGNDDYVGSANSQFQSASEGLEYNQSFILSSEQLSDFTAASISLLVKGVEAPTPVYVNDIQVGVLPISSTDGSYSEVLLDNIPIGLLAEQNTIVIRSMESPNQPGSYDDFEFANLLFKLN